MSAATPVRAAAFAQQVSRWQRYALVVGGVGVILCLLGAVLAPQQFFVAYLVGWLFWLGISLGCLAWLMVFHLTGGQWGRVARRLLEAGGLMTILLALLFLPLLLGLDDLFVWTHPDAVAADPLLQHKQPYLNLPFFLARLALYFIVWIGSALLLNQWSRQQERALGPHLERRLRKFGGFGLAAYGLTITFAAIDWLMSLDPHWFSSIFGLLVASVQVLGALAFIVLALAWLDRFAPFREVITPALYGDYGNLLLTATLLAAYLAFVQYLIIWAGNLPEEVTWYLQRRDTGWGWVALLLPLLQFALPFAALLSGRIKRSRRQLARLAGLLLFATWLHLFWLAAPVFHPERFYLHWLDVVAPLAIGGLWLAGFLWQVRSRPLLILPAVEAQETLAYE
jgi:hypothetical protein